jgi:hypothetical protein
MALKNTRRTRRMGTKLIHHKHLLLLWLLWKQSFQAKETHNNKDKERKNFDTWNTFSSSFEQTNLWHTNINQMQTFTCISKPCSNKDEKLKVKNKYWTYYWDVILFWLPIQGALTSRGFFFVDASATMNTYIYIFLNPNTTK